jgi:hypothetical protein
MYNCKTHSNRGKDRNAQFPYTYHLFDSLCHILLHFFSNIRALRLDNTFGTIVKMLYQENEKARLRKIPSLFIESKAKYLTESILLVLEVNPIWLAGTLAEPAFLRLGTNDAVPETIRKALFTGAPDLQSRSPGPNAIGPSARLSR